MIFINNATIITQDKNRRIIDNGAILIKENKINDIDKTKDVIKRQNIRNAKIINGENKVVMPGLINTHTHLAMSLLRGFADDMPLEKWWFEKIFPFEAKLTAEDIYWGTLLGGLEMIKSGTTAFFDFYFFTDAIARATKELGLRANIGVPVIDAKTPEFATPRHALAAIPQIIKRHRNEPLIDFSIAPHMIQTTSLETYKKCKKTANKYNLILQTHLAETKGEIKYSIKKYGKPPAELLVRNKVLDKNSIAAHACYLNSKEIKLISENRVKIAHCPTSNMKLASGIKPLKELLAANATIGLATDSACSNNNLDMFEEMKFAALLHKINRQDPAIANAQLILDMATINGAKVAGKEKEIGSLEKGKKADIIILDFNQPHLLPTHNFVSHLVYSANGADVITTIVNGKILMEERKVLIADEMAILNVIRRKYP
jgi:5-methylthioadenosine/S-adenosylhomocysteine deaminase